MSIRSRKIELAVSIPPAPRPIMVCVPECSDVNEIAFNVPLTHKGSTIGISFGATVNSLLHDAINLIAEFFSAARFISALSIFLIPVILISASQLSFPLSSLLKLQA